jgi:hypothetical protein
MPETIIATGETVCALHETNIYLFETLMLHNQRAAKEQGAGQ